MRRTPPISPRFPYTTLFRSLAKKVFKARVQVAPQAAAVRRLDMVLAHQPAIQLEQLRGAPVDIAGQRHQQWPQARQRDCRRQRRSEEHTSELQSRENLVCRL